MATPDYWPANNAFEPIQLFLSNKITASLTTEDANRYNRLMKLPGVIRAMDKSIDQLAKSTNATVDIVNTELQTPIPTAQNVDFVVAELPSTTDEFRMISTEVGRGPEHSAGYKQDKAVPARWVKKTPRAEGATNLKQFWEFFGRNRLSVQPGRWSVLTILICKNLTRWQQFETCRQNFRNVRNLGAKRAVKSFKDRWAIADNNKGQFPVIDAAIGECWLWSGQAMDIQHAIMSQGFQRIHCESSKATGYGALGRGNYFTDKFSKALLYAMNLRNLYYGTAKKEDIRVLLLSRVLLGNWCSLDNASEDALKQQRKAHNLELTGSAQRHKRNIHKGYETSVKEYRDQKLNRPAKAKGFKAQYKITGTNVDENIGHESVHMSHKGSNEFLVAMGKQVYPEFMVFVKRN